MINKNEIKRIYEQEITFLTDAIKNGKNKYHTFTLSTINNEYPELRTVVLRKLEKKPFKIFFNSDTRSPKIKELEKNKNCSALFYDFKRKMQLRLKCESVIYNKDKVSMEVWNKILLQSRKCYMAPYSPSQILKKWEPNIPIKYLKKDPEREESERGYENFSYIELKVIESDILQLHHDGHIRFKVRNNKFIFISS